MRKRIQDFLINEVHVGDLACYEYEVRELESYTAQLEKKLEEAVELLQETSGMLPISRTEKNIRDFLESIEQKQK
jgi:hypothetical protein